MDRYYGLGPRSYSMPSPGFIPQTTFFHPIPRKMSRRDSEMILSDGPITPPISPPPPNQVPTLPTPPVPVATSMETGQPQEAIQYPATPVSESQEEYPMDDDESESVPRAPARLLSDENLRLTESLPLKLTDFEVRGTLGM